MKFLLEKYNKWKCHWRISSASLTAGSAKKDMANTLKQDATIFPIQVCGTASP